MVLSELEKNVLKKAKEEILKAKDVNSLNKTYRQLRTWNRWHSIGLNRPFKDDETYVYINEQFKSYRNQAREELNDN